MEKGQCGHFLSNVSGFLVWAHFHSEQVCKGHVNPASKIHRCQWEL